jgi:hypothetical protein
MRHTALDSKLGTCFTASSTCRPQMAPQRIICKLISLRYFTVTSILKWSVPNRPVLCTVNTLLKSVRFVGAFAKLQKVTISFVMSLCLSVRPSVSMERLGSLWSTLIKFHTYVFSRKSVDKFPVPLQPNNNNRYFTWRPIHTYRSYLTGFSLEWENFQVNGEKIKTLILCSKTLSPKSSRLWHCGKMR